MAIQLASSIVTNLTAGTSVNLVAAPGNYSLQSMQVIVTGLLSSSGSVVYEFQGAVMSGNNNIQFVSLFGTAPSTIWFYPDSAASNPVDFSRTFADPLILTPNTAITFKTIANTSLIGIHIVINLYGFKS